MGWEGKEVRRRGKWSLVRRREFMVKMEPGLDFPARSQDHLPSSIYFQPGHLFQGAGSPGRKGAKGKFNWEVPRPGLAPQQASLMGLAPRVLPLCVG